MTDPRTNRPRSVLGSWTDRLLAAIGSRTERLLAVALAGVAVGAVPPWLLANPFYDGVAAAVYYPGQRLGLETWGMATLPLAVLAMAVLVARDGRAATASSALVGAGAFAVAADTAIQTAFTPWLLPGPGVVITAASGLAILAIVASARTDPER